MGDRVINDKCSKQDVIVLSAIQSESYSLRQTQIRSVHEVGELRRAQEMENLDEFQVKTKKQIQVRNTWSQTASRDV